ncbi:DUF547 domain-containing protein, partial [archaeon]
CMVENMKYILGGGSGGEYVRKLAAFLLPVNDNDIHFLGGNVEIEEDYMRGIWKGGVGLTLTSRHYTEQYMVITKDALVLYKHKDAKQHTLHLPLTHILYVRVLPPAHTPLPHMGYLDIHTQGRVFTLLIRSDMQLNGWLQVFITLGISEHSSKLRLQPSSSPPSQLSLLSANDIDDVYIAKNVVFKGEKRRIFNMRRVYFKDYTTSMYTQAYGSKDKGGMGGNQNIHPNRLIEDLLTLAFDLVQTTLTSTPNPITTPSLTSWLQFYDGICLLQTIPIHSLNTVQRLSFYLNLYHLMVLHGCIVYGPPSGWSYWYAFYNQIGYVVAGELVSIAELEYCILR